MSEDTEPDHIPSKSFVEDPRGVESGWQSVEHEEDPNLAGTIFETSEEPGKQDEEHEDIFDAVHSKKKRSGGKHLQQHGFDIPIKFTHLVKRPVVRQWLHKGNLYREEDVREPSRFELFFDLMFVGIAHLVAEGSTEDPSGVNILKFVLQYFPTWSVWMDVRTFLNISGTDDVKERFGLLFCMIMLTGYSANAAGLQIIKSEKGVTTSPSDNAGEHAVMLHDLTRKKTAFIQYNKLGAHIGGRYWFAAGYLDALKWAITFYLILRLFRIVLYVYYGWILPNFRPAMWTNAIVRTLVSVIYIPVIFYWQPRIIVTLMFIGMGAELLNSFIVLYLLRLYNYVVKNWTNKMLYVPAISIEHAIERMVLFVIVVVGEVIISSSYKADGQSYGFSHKFGRSVLAIFCSFLLIWIYYDTGMYFLTVNLNRRQLAHFPTRVSTTLCIFSPVLSAALPSNSKFDSLGCILS